MAVLVDVATGYVRVYPRATRTGEDVVDVLETYQGDVGGSISTLRTDGATEFSGAVTTAYLSDKRIRARAPPHALSSDGTMRVRSRTRTFV